MKRGGAIVTVACLVMVLSPSDGAALSPRNILSFPCNGTQRSGLYPACQAVNALFANYYDQSSVGGLPSLFHTGTFWGDGPSLEAVLDLAHISTSPPLVAAAVPLFSHVHSRRSFRVIQTFSGCIVPDKFKPKVCSYDDPFWWSKMWALADVVLGANGTDEESLRYLTTAKAVHDWVMKDGWAVARNGCVGGMCWKTPDESGHCYLNAVTNNLALQSSLQLHRALVRRNMTSGYLHQALMIWDWIQGSGLLYFKSNNSALVNDGVDWPDSGNCSNVPRYQGIPLSYNLGGLIEGLVQLHRYTGNHTLLLTASQLAVGSIELLTDSGSVFTEHSMTTRSSLYFKGVLLRSLRLLYWELAAYPTALDVWGTGAATSVRQQLSEAVQSSAASAAKYAKSSKGLYCALWQGPVNASCTIPGGFTKHNPDHLPLPYCVGTPPQTIAIHLLITNGSIGSGSTMGK